MARKVFLDTDCFSSFLRLHKTNYLKKVLSDFDVIVPWQVTIEINRKLKGLADLQAAYYSALANGDFTEAPDFEVGSPEYSEYLRLTQGIGYPKVIGNGEAAGLVLAKKNNGILASNNLKDIVYYAQLFGVVYITTCDILLSLYDGIYLSKKELETIFQNMLAADRILPYRSFAELLDARDRNAFTQIHIDKLK